MIELLLMQSAIPRDTVVTIAARDAVDVALAVAAISVALTFGAVLLTIVFAFLGVRRASLAASQLRRQIAEDPAIEHLRGTARNIEAISETLQGEVARLSASVAQLSDRLTQASDRMEERIEDFNALMEVVQDEAESAFVDGAATAKGVRAGLGRLSRNATSHPRPPEAHDGISPDTETSPNIPPRPTSETRFRPSVMDGGEFIDPDDIRD